MLRAHERGCQSVPNGEIGKYHSVVSRHLQRHPSLIVKRHEWEIRSLGLNCSIITDSIFYPPCRIPVKRTSSEGTQKGNKGGIKGKRLKRTRLNARYLERLHSTQNTSVESLIRVTIFLTESNPRRLNADFQEILIQVSWKFRIIKLFANIFKLNSAFWWQKNFPSFLRSYHPNCASPEEEKFK